MKPLFYYQYRDDSALDELEVQLNAEELIQNQIVATQAMLAELKAKPEPGSDSETDSDLEEQPFEEVSYPPLRSTN